MEWGRVGLWTYQVDLQPASVARATAAEIEQLGFRVVWLPDSTRRDVFGNAWLFLGATRDLAVAVGVASIYSRDATAMAMSQLTLCESFPDRFALGLGVSHRTIVEGKGGHLYGPPLGTMHAFLDAMARVDYLGPPVPVDRPVILAALGPKMIALGRDRASGIHPYHTTPDHTRLAREILGDGPFLAPEQPVVIDVDLDRARRIARSRLQNTLSQPNYLANLRRMGFSNEDLSGGGTDRLVDSLVACGSVERVLERVRLHLDAGADHVAVQVMVEDDRELPIGEWRELATAAARDGLL
jgi:probable F420-dependent oxidoreductase